MSTLVRALALPCLLSFLAAGTADAMARLMSRDELLAEAPLIAVVEVTSVAALETRGKLWTYRQAAQAKLVRSVRGELPETFSIHAQKDFRCARASYAKGRYLVFLQREGALYTTLNHDLGQFACKGGRVEFFKDGKGLEQTDQALAVVLETVSAPEAYFPEWIVTPERRYRRDTIRSVAFVHQARVLGKRRLLRGIYANRPPRAGNVRVTHLKNRYLLLDEAGGHHPLEGDGLRDALRKAFLANGVVAPTGKERAWVAAAYLFLLQGGEEPIGTWWGSRASEDRALPAGRVYEARWTHGKSHSWTDVFQFRYDAQGRLLAINHSERRH